MFLVYTLCYSFWRIKKQVEHMYLRLIDLLDGTGEWVGTAGKTLDNGGMFLSVVVHIPNKASSSCFL